MDGSKVGRGVEQRESSAVAGGNESEGGSRLSARALSISSALHADFFLFPVLPPSSPPRLSFHGTQAFSSHRTNLDGPVPTLFTGYVTARPSCPHQESYMSSVFRFVCGNYAGYIEPHTAAQMRDPKV
ncbi:uncharacterized protein LOC112459993 [Temnothorax curvispinosus]|uniref:Uncharacterized protein LOC112459993 n=1 Tax=Temnothorax curvispinosus TaxID=300111 RepID=A0A6J1QCX9_9HYME|nr:uncharacterized protein LOC112459993 [Temnothorax curvispinosus]